MLFGILITGASRFNIRLNHFSFLFAKAFLNGFLEALERQIRQEHEGAGGHRVLHNGKLRQFAHRHSHILGAVREMLRPNLQLVGVIKDAAALFHTEGMLVDRVLV